MVAESTGSFITRSCGLSRKRKAATAIDPITPTATATAIQGHGLLRSSPARPGAPGRGGSGSARDVAASSGEPIRGALSGPSVSAEVADTGGAGAFVSAALLTPVMPAANDARRGAAGGRNGGADRGGTIEAGAAAAALATDPRTGAATTEAEAGGGGGAALVPKIGALGATTGRGDGIGGGGGRGVATGLAGAAGGATAGGPNSASSRVTAASSAFSSLAMSLSGRAGFSDRSCPIRALRARS